MKRLALFVLLLSTLSWASLFQYEDVELVRIIDGDTVILRMQVAPDLYAVRPCRLLHINAPEMNTDAGKAARVALVNYLAGKRLAVSLDKTDSFGRWLVNLQADGKDVSQWELEQKIAVPFR